MGAQPSRRRAVPDPHIAVGGALELYATRTARGSQLLRAVDDRDGDVAGATAQQVQDELLNRMEKKLEQLDHFEKVVTFARQGYGGMTITVKGGTSKADQQEAWYQARKKLSDIRMELPEGVIGPVFNDEYGDVYGLLYAVKGDGIGQAELSDVCGGHQAAAAESRDGQEGGRPRQAGRTHLHGVLASAARRARHHAPGDCRKPAEARTASCLRVPRHAWRSRVGARERSVRQRRRHPQCADRRGRPGDQARRHFHRSRVGSKTRRPTR